MVFSGSAAFVHALTIGGTMVFSQTESHRQADGGTAVASIRECVLAGGERVLLLLDTATRTVISQRFPSWHRMSAFTLRSG